jgi:hypothetical protein
MRREDVRSRRESGEEDSFEVARERATRSRWVFGESAAARQMDRIWSGGGGGEDLRREMARRVFSREVSGVVGEEGLRIEAGDGGVAVAVERRRRRKRRAAAAMAASGLGFRSGNDLRSAKCFFQFHFSEGGRIFFTGKRVWKDPDVAYVIVGGGKLQEGPR